MRYKAVPGLRFEQLLGPNARDGAQLITPNCGFMIH